VTPSPANTHCQAHGTVSAQLSVSIVPWSLNFRRSLSPSRTLIFSHFIRFLFHIIYSLFCSSFCLHSCIQHFFCLTLKSLGAKCGIICRLVLSLAFLAVFLSLSSHSFSFHLPHPALELFLAWIMISYAGTLVFKSLEMIDTKRETGSHRSVIFRQLRAAQQTVLRPRNGATELKDESSNGECSWEKAKIDWKLFKNVRERTKQPAENVIFDIIQMWVGPS